MTNEERQDMRIALIGAMTYADSIHFVTRMDEEAREYRDAICQHFGHKKGGGAWEGVSYCKTCRSQLDNAVFEGDGLGQKAEREV